MSMIENFKQLKYPKEFRIEQPIRQNNLLEALEEISGLMKSIPKETVVTQDKDERELERFLAEIGTGLWRIRNKLMQPLIKESTKEMHSVIRSLESTWDVLTQGGIEIKDHTGEPIIGGEALHILTFQPSADVTRDEVIETIKPTIYYKGKMIQIGEVVVGTPEKN